MVFKYISQLMSIKIKKARFQLKLKTGFKKIPGGVLLSHPAARAVPSALKSLTSVFEMGTGVASSPLPPGNLRGERREP
jgi:hypothetical protein